MCECFLSLTPTNEERLDGKHSMLSNLYRAFLIGFRCLHVSIRLNVVRRVEGACKRVEEVGGAIRRTEIRRTGQVPTSRKCSRRASIAVRQASHHSPCFSNSISSGDPIVILVPLRRLSASSSISPILTRQASTRHPHTVHRNVSINTHARLGGRQVLRKEHRA
jgi:hypothetical protein